MEQSGHNEFLSREADREPVVNNKVLVSHWRDASASRGQSFGRCLQQPPIHWAQRHTIVGMQISKKETPSQPLQPSQSQKLRPKEKSIRTSNEDQKHFKTKREKNRDFYPGNRYVPIDPKGHVDVIRRSFRLCWCCVSRAFTACHCP